MNDGDSLDCVNYVSDVFDASTGIWWHCDDANIIEISDFLEGVYTKDSCKLTIKKGKFYQDLKIYCL